MTSKRQRSPAFPAISLSEALQRLSTFYKAEGKHAAMVETAASHWGYKANSSGGKQTVAALKAYGLIDDEGSGKDRKIRVSDFGLSIIQDERAESPEREQAIERAALMPKMMLDMWQSFGSELPSYDTVRHYLLVDKEFNPNAIDGFVKTYRENIAFAKPSKSDILAADDSEKEGLTTNTMASEAAQRTQASHSTSQIVNQGEEIANIRVSRNSTIRLIANGPYSRQSIEALVKQLTLSLDLGAYDDVDDEGKIQH